MDDRRDDQERGPLATDLAASRSAAIGGDSVQRILHAFGLASHDDGSDAAESELPPGARVGRYRVRSAVGRGGMGVVYAAEDETDGRAVALKLVAARMLGNARAHVRFEREIAIASRLHHTGIAKVLGTGSVGERRYYAMEFVDGISLARAITSMRERGKADWSRGTLAEVLRAERAAPEPAQGAVPAQAALALPTTDDALLGAVELAIQVAEALEHAHRLGIVHRDVKPGNVLLCADGRPVLTDFGLARDLEASSLTESGDVVGTLRYAAPEQWLDGDGEVDQRADVYGLGATLYEMLTLHVPLQTAPLERASGRPRLAPPLDPRAHDTRIPSALARVVLRTLEQDPVLRHPSAGALADDLRSVLDDGSEVAPAPPLRARVAARFRRRPVSSTLALAALLVLPVIARLALDLAEARPALAAERRRDEFALACALLMGPRESTSTLPVAELSPGTPTRSGSGHGAELPETVALGMFMRLWRDVPDDPTATAVGLAYARGRRYEGLLAWLDGEARGRVPAELELLRADALRQLGREQDARNVEHAVAGLEGCRADFVRAHLTLLDPRVDPQRRERACDLLERAAFEGDEADKALYYFGLARAFGQYASQRQALSAARAIETSWGETAAGQFFVGLALGRWDRTRAFEAFRRVPPSSPLAAIAYYSQGVLLGDDNQFAQAAAVYREALRLSPRDARVAANLCHSLSNGGGDVELAEAIEVARAAIEFDDCYPTIQQNLAHMLHKAWQRARAAPAAVPAGWRNRSMLDEALVHVERALELDPEYTFAWNTLGLVLRGRPSPARADLERARHAFERAIELLPDYAYAYENLFELLWFDLDDREAAFAVHQRSIERVRGSSWIWYQRAGAAMELPRERCADRARIALDAGWRAVALADRARPAYLDTLAAACEELGQRDLACSLQEEAVELLGTEPLDAFLVDLDVVDDVMNRWRRLRTDRGLPVDAPASAPSGSAENSTEDR